MNRLNYEEIELISLNVGGWRWRISNELCESRLKRTCAYIRSKMSNPLVIALQEVQLSGGKYLKVLEKQFPDYQIVLPKGYKNQPKSVISVLLINKDLCESFSVGSLDGLEDSLRYNFVTINTHITGLCFRILNINVPHTCFNANSAEWYRKEREELRTSFLNSIKELASDYHSEPDLKLIILGDFNATPESEFITSMAYTYYNRPMVDAVRPENKNVMTWRSNETNAESRLDYIFYSSGMLCDSNVRVRLTQVHKQPILQGLSDHCMLIGGILLDIA